MKSTYFPPREQNYFDQEFFPDTRSTFPLPEQVHRANLRFQRGVEFQSRGLCEEAVESFAEAVVLAPSNTQYLLSLGQLEFELGHLPEASLCFERLSRLEPKNPSAWLTLGYIHYQLQEYEDAIVPLSEAVLLDPISPDSTFYLAESLRKVERYAESVPLYQKLLSVGIDVPQAVYGYSLSLLALGRLEEGWEAFEFRRLCKIGTWNHHFLVNWDGVPDEKLQILAYSEEGIAADIMYASCLPDLIRNVGRCVVECDEILHPIFARSFPQADFIPLSGGNFEAPIEQRILQSRLETHPGIDPPPVQGEMIETQIAFGSLPRFFRKTWTDFPGEKAFLVPDADIARQWKDTLNQRNSSAKVGFLWEGTRTCESVEQRKIPLDKFRSLLSVGKGPGDTSVPIDWVCLQQKTGRIEAEERKIRSQWRIEISQFSQVFGPGGIEELAGLLSALDLVISPPGYVANLAAGLGVPTWLILPYPADWCWTLHEEKSPWFPSLRLFRQHRGESLDEVMNKLVREIKMWGEVSSRF